MRVNWNYIKITLLLFLVVFLYAFSESRNSKLKISGLNIEFLGENTLFVTGDTVSKLLIQNNQTVTNMTKETLDLNGLEAALNSNPMIKQAEVYVAVDGALTAKILQKKPIARVNTNASYYIDEDGSYMPLSSNYTARVPLVTGSVKKNDLIKIFKVAKTVQADAFLKTHVIEIHQHNNKDVSVKLRQYDFYVQLGDTKQLDKKFNNLKAFYQKALKDKTLNSYSNVNLRFENQVVCTKK